MPDHFKKSKRDGVPLIALGYGNNYRRSDCMSGFHQGLVAAAAAHPSDRHIGHDVTIGMGTVVLAGAVANVSARIGRGCIINTGAIVEHGCTIGDWAAISPGASLASDVRVGSFAFVGIGASVRGGVTIGDRSVIGGGAMVVDHIEPGILSVGVPARKVRTLEAAWSPVGQ